MRSIDDTNFPESIRENVPGEWREAVGNWVESHLGTLIPRIYLDHDFVEWVAGSVEPLLLNNVDPSYSFFRSLSPKLSKSFNPGDAVNISFNAEAETVLFLGEGRWDRIPLAPKKEGKRTFPPDGPYSNLLGGIWPGIEFVDY